MFILHENVFLVAESMIKVRNKIFSKEHTVNVYNFVNNEPFLSASLDTDCMQSYKLNCSTTSHIRMLTSAMITVQLFAKLSSSLRSCHSSD